MPPEITQQSNQLQQTHRSTTYQNNHVLQFLHSSIIQAHAAKGISGLPENFWALN
jgi:hypothetical protein